MLMAKEAVLYEAMYIVDPGLSEEEITALEDRLKGGLESEGAQVESIHEMGRRRMSYEIKGHREGLYKVMYFRGTGAAVTEIKHEFLLSEEVIRGLVVVANPKFMVGPKPQPVAEPVAEEEAVEEVAEEAAEAPAEVVEEAPEAPEVAEVAEETAAEAPEAPVAEAETTEAAPEATE